MIHLTKTAEPQVLKDNSEAWTKALQHKIASGQQPTQAEKAKYRHPQVKAALVGETHGKCAYCESPLLHIHHGDVEHIYPKSLDISLIFSWDNLTLACEVCNQKKSNLDPNIEHIIDPYKTDPSDHLAFAGTLVFPTGTQHGQSTKVILDLNRGELVEQRKERLEKLLQIVDAALRPGVPAPVKAAIVADLKAQATDAASPYAGMGRCFYESIEAKLAA